jgi:hypothetical protein
MNTMIQTNSHDNRLKDLLIKLGDKADIIKIASAFFSDTELITRWTDQSKKIHLIVSLRPPTNYYALKSIQIIPGIKTHFLGDNFHSKFLIFYNNEKPFSCIVGSSNFTPGGLYRNIETNVLLTNQQYLFEIENHFNSLFEQSYVLQPSDLDDYKSIFDKAAKRFKSSDDEQDEFQKRILPKRTIQKKKLRISRKAQQYLVFWRMIDDVKGIVKEISIREYPDIPIYLTIDHFWHWIKTVWSKENRPKPNSNNRNTVIPKLFAEYCKWDKRTVNHTTHMGNLSKDLFSRLLSQDHIDKLTTDEAKNIFRNLHSGGNRAQRFSADIDFVHQNTIQQIRSSLKYLLYSNDDIELRIHNLCENHDFKLNQLKYSGIQEIIGWVNPDKFPLRNDKADDALSMIGYDINNDQSNS